MREGRYDIERLNVNFKTDEEKTLLAHVKAQAALRRVRLREHLLDVLRDATQHPRTRRDA